METGCRIHSAREGTTVLTKLAREGNVRGAIELLHQMRSSTVKMDEVNYRCVLFGTAWQQDWHHAMNLMTSMHQNEITKNQGACNAAISACRGIWTLGIHLLYGMQGMQLRAEVTSYSNAANAFLSSLENWHMSLHTFQELQCLSLEVDGFCESIALSTCRQKWQLVLQQLNAFRVVPNMVCLNAGISSFSEAKYWHRALGLMDEAQGTGLQNAPNFTEALLPPAPCWDSEPTGLEAPMPMTVSSTLPSVGSILHGTGTCKPCAWFWKPQGCNNGADCGHCHMCPAGESKSRRQAKMAAWRSTTSTLRVPAPSKEEPVLWRPPPGLEPELTPPAPVPPASNVPALGSVGSAKHSTGECTLCPDAFTPEGCPKGPQCDKCHLCAAEFRAVTDDGDGDVVGVVHGTVPCILCGTNKCSCPRIHSGVAAEQVEILAEAPSTDLPSLGSVLHAKGTCSPCAWVWKPQGCHNGRSCGRCHLCPAGEVKLRKKAKAREARHVRKEYFCSSY